MARFYDPTIAHFVQADSIIPEAGSSKGYDRYGYTNNNPVRYTDPSGHMISEGCGEDGKSACTPRAQEIADYNYFMARYEQKICKAGNYKYCTLLENETYNNRPITGVYLGWSGQAGFGAEVGPNIQDEIYLDWMGGNIYLTRTVGGAVSIGTPSIMNGQINLGLMNTRGIPLSYSNQQVINALEGPQIDVSGSFGFEAFAVVDIGFGRSQDVNQDGTFVRNKGSEMYTDSLGFSIGFDTFPNLVDGGFQVGMSQTSLLGIIHLW